MTQDGGCPTQGELSAFLMGACSAEALESVERHLAECQACAQSVGDLPASDTLIEAIRGGTVEQHGADLQPFIDRLRSWTATELLERTGNYTSDPSVRSAAVDVGALLDPAEREGELGWLGDYRVLRVLGTGGMGVVFEAFDIQLNRSVALKTLRSTVVDPAQRRRFLNEARAMASLQHDNVVPILHVGEANERPFLVMPLLSGETLAARLTRDGSLTSSEVLQVAIDICRGLDAAHSSGFVHRDIKPSNVWLDADTGRAKLLDFGLARAFDAGSELTRTGAMLGTPGYLSPEQARGERVDVRSDLFSVGALMYRAVTGKLPFPGGNALAMLRALELKRPKSPATIDASIPKGLSRLIQRLLEKQPQRRVQSAAALGDLLAHLQRGGHLAPSRRNSMRGLLLSVIVVVAMLGSYGAYALFTGGSFDGERDAVISSHKNERSPPTRCDFSAPQIYSLQERPLRVVTADVNADGALDLVTTSTVQKHLRVLVNDGTGHFSFGWEQTFPAQVYVALPTDMDADGQLDLLVSSQIGGVVWLVRGEGDGRFSDPQVIAKASGARTLALADVDDDGIRDLVVSQTQIAGKAAIFRGLPSGFAETPVTYDCGRNTISVDAVDLNGDGAVDLAASNGGSDTVSIFINLGDGTFADGRNYGVGSGPGMLAIADFNDDGIVDIASENVGSNDVSVLYGVGDGSFELARTFAAGLGPGGLVARDMNDDGLPDLIVANHHGFDVSLLFARRDKSFTSAQSVPAGNTPAGIIAADLNNDSIEDIAVVNHHGWNLMVLHGRPLDDSFRISVNSETTPGRKIQLGVTAIDANNSLDGAFRGTIEFHCTDPLAELPEPYSFSDSDAGLHSFSAVPHTSGTQVIRITEQGTTRSAWVSVNVRD